MYAILLCVGQWMSDVKSGSEAKPVEIQTMMKIWTIISSCAIEGNVDEADSHLDCQKKASYLQRITGNINTQLYY